MADIFISYKRENQDAVERVVRGLRDAKLSVWWDRDISPNAPWEATIEAELAAAKVVIVAWSRAAVASENVKAEARSAREAGKLIQIFVEPCAPPLFFGERQGVDLTNWNGTTTDARFRALIEGAQAVRAGRRPPQGVGYAPPRRSGAPLLGGLALVAALVAVGLVVAPRDQVCALAPLPGLCAADAQSASQPTEIRIAGDAAAADAAELLPAGVEHRIVVPAGYAFDLDTGRVAEAVFDGADFVLSGSDGDFFLDQVGDPAGSRPDTSGAATRAACAPGEYYYRNYLADPGEYNCFTTLQRREGALVRQHDQAGLNGAVLTYRFWED